MLAWAGHWYDYLHVPYSASKGQDGKHDRMGLMFSRVVPDWQQLVEEPKAVPEPKEADVGDAAITIEDSKPCEATWAEQEDWDHRPSSSNAQARNGLEPKCISLCTSYFRWKQASWQQDRKTWQKFEQNIMALYYSRPNITKQVDNLTWK